MTDFLPPRENFMRGSYEESFTGGGLELLDAEHLSQLFEKVVKTLLERKLRHRGPRRFHGFCGIVPDAFHVFVTPLTEEKVSSTYLTRKGKTAQEAEELIESVDRERAAFIKKYYGRVWPQRDLYHLMLNSKAGDDVVIDMILRGMDHFGGPQAIAAETIPAQLSRPQ